MLLTHTLGIFTLDMSACTDHHGVVFALVCCFKFIPAVLAIALVVAAHTK